MFSLKPYTLAGFEPWFSVTEADAIATAPRRQGKLGFSFKNSCILELKSTFFPQKYPRPAPPRPDCPNYFCDLVPESGVGGHATSHPNPSLDAPAGHGQRGAMFECQKSKNIKSKC
jgi:hypothetical protein